MRELAERLLAGIWVVESLAALPAGTRAVAVTRSGRLFDPGTGLLVQAPSGGAERLLEELGRREQLVAASESAAADEAQARTGIEQATSAVAAADVAREAGRVRAAAGPAPGRRGRRRRRPGRVAARAPP